MVVDFARAPYHRGRLRGMNAPPAPLNPPRRVLMGPGPSDVAPSVLEALGRLTVGHLDPYFLTVMDEVRAMLRTAFDTTAELCFPMSGTGSAGMETCFANLLEPGDRVLVGIHGVFGRAWSTSANGWRYG